LTYLDNRRQRIELGSSPQYIRIAIPALATVGNALPALLQSQRYTECRLTRVLWSADAGLSVERPEHSVNLAGLKRSQNGRVEGRVGSIGRKSLDHLVVFDEAQLRRVLKNFASYYNQIRTHLSFDKNPTDFRCPQKLGPYRSHLDSKRAASSICQGLGFD
jgi:hypothetical protein